MQFAFIKAANHDNARSTQACIRLWPLGCSKDFSNITQLTLGRVLHPVMAMATDVMYNDTFHCCLFHEAGIILPHTRNSGLFHSWQPAGLSLRKSDQCILSRQAMMYLQT